MDAEDTLDWLLFNGEHDCDVTYYEIERSCRYRSDNGNPYWTLKVKPRHFSVLLDAIQYGEERGKKLISDPVFRDELSAYKYIANELNEEMEDLTLELKGNVEED